MLIARVYLGYCEKLWSSVNPIQFQIVSEYGQRFPFWLQLAYRILERVKFHIRHLILIRDNIFIEIAKSKVWTIVRNNAILAAKNNLPLDDAWAASSY